MGNITQEDFINDVTDQNIDTLLKDDDDIEKYSEYCEDDNFEFSV